MRGGVLPPALLCAALSLVLAFARSRVRARSLVALAMTATLLADAPVPHGWLETVFLGCWMSLAATAMFVHLRDGPTPRVALALSINAGLWSGAVIALAGSPLDLLESLLCALVLLPAGVLTVRRAPIVVKVFSSWLIAVAVLAGALQCLPVTPGYMPDHLD